MDWIYMLHQKIKVFVCTQFCYVFRMHTVLLWSINDFLAYAVLLWNTKGRLAPLCCLSDTHNI